MAFFKKIIFPHSIYSKSIRCYLILLFVSSILFFQYVLPWYFILLGIVEVTSFFYFSYYLVHKWDVYKICNSKTFEKKIFYLSFAIRLVYVCFSLAFYNLMTGTLFEWNASDSEYYHIAGQYVSSLISDGEFNFIDKLHEFSGADISDMGYPIYIGVVYWIFGDSVFIARVIKSLLASLTIVLLYRFLSRNFDENTSRLTAIFCTLMPELIYYCGLHLKEIEMVFLIVLFFYESDKLINGAKNIVGKTILLLIIVSCLFTIRTPVAILCVVSFLFSLLFMSQRKLSMSKKILIISAMLCVVSLSIGNKLINEAKSLYEQAQSSAQETNMNFRSQRKNGNKYAKYAGAAIFAPLIFTLPFPTMVNVPEQEHQKMIHGGVFVKNEISIFVILAIIFLVLKGEWRRFIFPMSFLLGYLVILVFSQFAHSERFHIPALPFELTFAAYFMQQLMSHKHIKYYKYWLVFIGFVCIGWQWFKLSGRGLI